MKKSALTLSPKDYSLIARIAVAAAMAIVSCSADILPPVKITLCVIGFLIAAYELIAEFFIGFAKLDFFSEKLLMIISAVLAFILGHYPSAVLAGILFRFSKLLSDNISSSCGKFVSSLGGSLDMGKKSRFEAFSRSALKFYVPIIIIAAAAIAALPTLVFKQEQTVWLTRAAVLVFSACPCAVILAVSLSYLSAVGSAAEDKVHITYEGCVERLASLNTVVLDRDYILSGAKYTVSSVLPSDGMSKENLLKLASIALTSVNDPFGGAVLQAYGNSIDTSRVIRSKTVPGLGTVCQTNGLIICAGGLEMMKGLGLGKKADEVSFTRGDYDIHIAANRLYIGCVRLVRSPNTNAEAAVDKLIKLGMNRIVLFSAENEKSTARAAHELHIDEYFHNCSEQDKKLHLEHLLAETFPEETLAYVGESEELLGYSDVGISSDASMKGCGAVIAPDMLDSLSDIIALSRMAKKVALHGLIFSITAKVILFAAVFFGFAPFWLAVIADGGIAVLTALNALRAAKKI